MAKLIHLHELDNVAITLEALEPQQEVSVGGVSIVAATAIDAMHKVATAAIPKGERILKYGQFIGYAAEDIQPGEHVHTHNCVVGDFEKDYGFCRNVTPTAFVSEENRATFNGFRRVNGKVGTRNYIGILTTVNCSATVAKQIAATFSYPGALADFPKCGWRCCAYS